MVMLTTFFVMLVIFSMYLIGHEHPESVTHISNLSPTHLVSNIRNKHRCNRDFLRLIQMDKKHRQNLYLLGQKNCNFE